MHFGVPCHLQSTVLNQLVELAGFTEEILYDKSESSDTYQCYQMTALPSVLVWDTSYHSDKRTDIILSSLSMNNKPYWEKTN